MPVHHHQGPSYGFSAVGSPVQYCVVIGTNFDVPNIGSHAASATISLKKSVVSGTTRACLSGSLESSSRIAEAFSFLKRLLLPAAGVPFATTRRWCQLRSMFV